MVRKFLNDERDLIIKSIQPAHTIHFNTCRKWHSQWRSQKLENWSKKCNESLEG